MIRFTRVKGGRLTIFRDDKDIIAGRWHEAAGQCQSHLRRMSTLDYQIAQHLKSHMSLLQELRLATDIPATQDWANDVEL